MFSGRLAKATDDTGAQMTVNLHLRVVSNAWLVSFWVSSCWMSDHFRDKSGAGIKSGGGDFVTV